MRISYWSADVGSSDLKEVHDDENLEDDQADDVVAADDEVAERLDDVTGGIGPRMAVGENEPGRCEVQRQPQHRRDQQDRREGVQLERMPYEHNGHQDDHRESHRKRQQERKRVVKGKSVSVRVDLGGRRINKKKKNKT